MIRPQPACDFPKWQHHFPPHSNVCDRCGADLLFAADIGAPGCISDAEVENRRQKAIAGKVMARLRRRYNAYPS